MQRDAQKLQLNESWWDWVNRAKHLDAQRDSMVSVFLAEHNRADTIALFRSIQEATDSLSESVEKLVLASSIWERQAQRIAESMTSIEGQLDRESEEDSVGWVSQQLLMPPPRLLAYKDKPRNWILGKRVLTDAVMSYASAMSGATGPKAMWAAYDEFVHTLDSWKDPTEKLLARDDRKRDKP